MLELYFWTTPNGYKPLMFLEETGLDYRVRPINISQGEQFDPEFLKISPNNRIPALVDRQPATGSAPIAMFESGVILLYLAEKTGRFIPEDQAGRVNVLKWLFWQVGGLGPMAGQNLHFNQYAPESIAYAVERYTNETVRLFKVMDQQLAESTFLAGDYSIADMAAYPWIHKHEFLQVDLAAFRNLERWYRQIQARPATRSAYEIGAGINTVPTVNAESRKILLGQGAN